MSDVDGGRRVFTSLLFLQVTVKIVKHVRLRTVRGVKRKTIILITNVTLLSCKGHTYTDCWYFRLWIPVETTYVKCPNQGYPISSGHESLP